MDDKKEKPTLAKIAVGAGLLGFGYLLYDALTNENPIHKKLLNISESEETSEQQDIAEVSEETESQEVIKLQDENDKPVVYRCWNCNRVVDKNATYCPLCGVEFGD